MTLLNINELSESIEEICVNGTAIQLYSHTLPRFGSEREKKLQHVVIILVVVTRQK